MTPRLTLHLLRTLFVIAVSLISGMIGEGRFGSFGKGLFYGLLFSGGMVATDRLLKGLTLRIFSSAHARAAARLARGDDPARVRGAGLPAARHPMDHQPADLFGVRLHRNDAGHPQQPRRVQPDDPLRALQPPGGARRAAGRRYEHHHRRAGAGGLRGGLSERRAGRAAFRAGRTAKARGCG